MHEYFPSEYFRYILILSALAVIGWLLARLLSIVARPSRDTRLKQYRESYEAFLCPVCQYPIRRGPLQVHVVDAAEPAAGIEAAGGRKRRAVHVPVVRDRTLRKMPELRRDTARAPAGV